MKSWTPEVIGPTVTPYCRFLCFLKLLFTEANITEVLGNIASGSDQFSDMGSLGDRYKTKKAQLLGWAFKSSKERKIQ